MKIAIIGTGISGLGAAYLLAPHHDITVYEKEAVTGGHSRTVDVKMDSRVVPVDTGFIVLNDRNYPNLTALFARLGVDIEKSNMSFAASIKDGWLEYGTKDTASIFAQKKNLLRPAFYRMIADVFRFNRQAHRYIDSMLPLGACLDELRMGEWFRRYFLLAMGGAIWSAPLNQMLQFPARSFIRFFDNHGLLTINDQPQWCTVTGGSREYIKKLTAPFADKIRTQAGVTRITRADGKVQVTDTTGNTDTFDHAVLACHADQALGMLDKPSADEMRVLGSFRYQKNRAVTHSDVSFMPKIRACWASWVYLSQNVRDDTPLISLSYWMNSLQNLVTPQPLIVTLNPAHAPDPKLVYDEHMFEHPVFDEAAIAAQGEIARIQNVNNISYCGAYQRYGFHEDGLWSAVNVARGLKAPIPWD